MIEEIESKDPFVLNVGVAGSGEMDDKKRVKKIMRLVKDRLLVGRKMVIHHGGRHGLDRTVDAWACHNNVETIVHKSRPDQHGSAAIAMRNSEILENVDLLIAFTGGRGTKDCVNQAILRNVPVIDEYETMINRYKAMMSIDSLV